MTVVQAYPLRFSSIHLYTDSLCTVGALKKHPSSMKPFFGNRVAEVARIREQIATFTDDLRPVSHIPGESNPADVGTRGLVGVGDLGPGSMWQAGPNFLREPVEDWPQTSGECGVEGAVPLEECSSSAANVFLAAQGGNDHDNPFRKLLDVAGSESLLGEQVAKLCQHVLSREKLELSARVLARVLSAVVRGDRERCTTAPQVKMVEIAVRILLRSASVSARKALKAGQLRGLGGEERGGMVWVTGRVRGEQLAPLLGTSALPVLLASEPLAYSLLHKAHREDHRRGPRDAAARSRRSAWVVGATRLAKTTIGRCYACRYRDRRLEKQLMGALPAERLEVVAPFESTALDLFGPFWVKDPAKGRRRFKCWVVAYICMGAKAVCLLPCPGYGAQEFMTTHRYFTGLYGRPKLVYTDHAPSLVKAAETPDWAQIASMVGDQGTVWRQTAKGCSWRNGLAERVIRAARHTLGNELRKGETLDFHQFGAILSVVSAIINARPLSVKLSTEGDFHVLAPRDVLFGRAGRSADQATRSLDFTLDLDQDTALDEMSRQQAKIVTEWKAKWKEQVFPDMVARPKWRSAHRNLRVGDIGHVLYPRKVGEDEWRIARVEGVEPDVDQVVRTVTVSFRPRNKRDTGKPYVSKTAQRLEIGVQRFAVLMAQEELQNLGKIHSQASETTLN